MLVVLQPHSLTNNSPKYQVVDSHNWMQFANGAISTCAKISFDTYAEAADARDKGNQLDK